MMPRRTPASSGYRRARWLVDPALAAVLLVLVSPILLVAAVLDGRRELEEILLERLTRTPESR